MHVEQKKRNILDAGSNPASSKKKLIEQKILKKIILKKYFKK